ncbi:hypothetical protein [Candidatus Leptofilum sp.]|uniref:hypothetical protein n=1 Tax=Candidatus Leptofilum sp. TaxID=3241576 RepID=UPI003B5A4E04
MKISEGDWLAQLQRNDLEDFWQRRANELRYQWEVRLFSHPLMIESNIEEIFTAVFLALNQYTQTEQAKPPLGGLQLVVQPMRQPPGPAPNDLMQQITYSGSADWLMMQLGSWGVAHLDLMRRRGTAVLDPQLAARPDLVAQCVLHTLLLNLVISHGYGMLHASCLVRDGVALLLLASHNTGKSTTALRLALAGFRLLTDSMVFVDEDGFLHGFPVGLAKLRGDMVPQFPELRPFLQPEIVRQETKYRVDLRRVNPNFVQETAVHPQKIILCLLSRHEQEETVVEDVAEKAVIEAILQNSLYVDQPQVWQQNVANLQGVLVGGTAVALKVGTIPSHLMLTVENLAR